MTQDDRQRHRRSLALQDALVDAEERDGRQHRAKLAELAQRRNAAIHAFDSTTEELGDIVLDAREAGLSITEIAQVLGVSRPAVYSLMERAAERDPRDRPSAHVRGGRQGVRASFQIYKDNGGEFRWRLVATNGQSLAESSGSFATRAAAARAIDHVARQAAGARVVAQY